MSPLSLRRYRAERLLRQQFGALHTGVIAAVARRLCARGVALDDVDLEACYATAWHGLYAAVLSGEQIENPAGWLAVVTFRRAIDEHRARRRLDLGAARDAAEADACGSGADVALAGRGARDLAAELDDRARLRELFEGLRTRLSTRELQAATLCYLHGLSRSQAAARMGVSEARMRKLMEGQGPGRPGVAGKVGALVATIRDGDWCEQQGSLMRGLALGILDPAGERYRLARAHRDQCPACRAYVRSLRGLAVVLPPAPALLRTVLASAGGAGAGAGAHGGASLHAGLAGRAALAGRAGGAGSSAGGPPAAGAVGAGGGAAGGGWLVAGGGAATKVVVGCLVAAGVGAGCVALNFLPAVPPHGVDHGERARSAAHTTLAQRVGPGLSAARAEAVARPTIPVSAPARPATLTPQARASQEFGPERPGAADASGTPATAPGERSERAVAAGAGGSVGSGAAAASDRAAQSVSAAGRQAGGASQAQREFGIG